MSRDGTSPVGNSGRFVDSILTFLPFGASLGSSSSKSPISDDVRSGFDARPGFACFKTMFNGDIYMKIPK